MKSFEKHEKEIIYYADADVDFMKIRESVKTGQWIFFSEGLRMF